MAANVVDMSSAEATGGYPCESVIREMTTTIAERMPYFHRIALRRVGNEADAEDALQDAFLSAYKYLGQFKGEARMSTWLTTIVINSALMKLRRRPRYPHLPIDGQDGEQEDHTFVQFLTDARPGPEELCRRWELAEKIITLSARLSPTLRRTFELRDVEGLTIRETAVILGVKDSTVKARVARARARLREWIEENSAGERVRRQKVTAVNPPTRENCPLSHTAQDVA